MTSPAASPICARCRQSIAGPSRRDRFGNAYCDACARALIEASNRAKQRTLALQSIRQHAPAGVATPGPTQPADAIPLADSIPLAEAGPAPPLTPSGRPPRPDLAPEPTPQPAHAPIIPDLSLPPEQAGPEGTIGLEPAAEVKPQMRACENCTKSINAAVSVCPYCQYDARMGPPGKLKGPIHACENCGYDLAGLPEPICPECGTKNPRKSARRLELERESREAVRRAYKRPAIMLGVGLLGLILLSLIAGRPSDLLFLGIWYVLGVPVGLGVYTACCYLWIGFDMPLHLIGLRLAAIYAVVGLVGSVVGRLHLYTMLALPIVLVTYVSLLIQELDLEFQDAVIFAILTGFATGTIGFIVFAVLGHFGLQF